MFEEIAGLPLHPLVIHAPIVFVPLLVLAAVAYALAPKLRRHVAWVAAALAVVAPLSTVAAYLSGTALRQRYIDRGQAPPQILEPINTHRDFGTTTMWFTIALGVLTLGLLATRHWGGGRKATGWALGGLTVLLVICAAVTAYYWFRTGDTGGRSVWEGR